MASDELSLEERASRIARLSPRATEVVRGLIAHYARSEKEIASDLGIAVPTLKTYVARAYAGLGVRSRLELFAVYHPLFAPCACPHARSAGVVRADECHEPTREAATRALEQK